jgi:hypothetical protein
LLSPHLIIVYLENSFQPDPKNDPSQTGKATIKWTDSNLKFWFFFYFARIHEMKNVDFKIHPENQRKIP